MRYNCLAVYDVLITGTSVCFAHEQIRVSPGAHPASYTMGTRSVPGGGGVKRPRGMALTTHPHLVPRLRMSGAVPQLPLWASVACSRVNCTLLWIKRDQLDVTCFIISLFNAQHVSDVNTSILRSLRLICWVISLVVLLWFDVCWCYVVVWLWWCGIRMQAEALFNA